MRKIICFAVSILVTCCLVGIGQASDAGKDENHGVEERTKLHLSEDLLVILNEEMNGIEQGMMKIISGISAGNWEDITSIAQKIKNSFILKQKLTGKQFKELHDSLPAEFIEMDQYFHLTAENLAHAASRQDVELVNFYYYKLHSQCVKCHSKYASERFPNFKNLSKGKSKHD